MIMRFKSRSYSQPNKTLINDMRRAGRAPLVLGNRLQITDRGMKHLGREYYYPSTDVNNVENLFIYGPSGSGKTWGMMSLIGQSYFKERRSWVIIDSKGSVTYDTLVYVRINGQEQILPIGEIIDAYIPDGDYAHKALDISDDIYALSLDDEHKLTWKRVKQVSKHDPNGTILKFTMRSDRTVKATKNHSFITLKNGKYTSVEADKLEIGQFIPVANRIPEGGLAEIDMSKFFDPSEILDYDVMVNALAHPEIEVSPMVAYNESGICSITYGAFQRYNDAEREVFPGYFKIVAGRSRALPFPKKIEMSADFGFFCGMFIAEGRATNKKNVRRIVITNTSPELRDRLYKWLDEMDISYTFDGNRNIKIYSHPLAHLFAHWFGNGINTSSRTKHLHSIIFNANKSFLKGFVDGYLSGDGSVGEMPSRWIKFDTSSEMLLYDLCIIFTKLEMPIRISQYDIPTGRMYKGSLHSSDYDKMKGVGFTHHEKNRRLSDYDVSGYDAKHLINIKNILSGLSHRKEPKKISSAIYQESSSITNAWELYNELKEIYPDRAKKLKKMLDGDVWWDKITNIDEIESPSKYVYDFAVDVNENFMLANGLIVHNSYRQNNLPNEEHRAELQKFDLEPQGIPAELMVVCAPEYYINGLTDEKIQQDQITHRYRIPIAMANIPILFEITKLQAKTQYAASYNMEWKQTLARTMGKPKKEDLYRMLNNIAVNSNQSIQRWSENLIDRIRAAEALTLCETPFSPIGAALLQAAYDHYPRWIVMTFKHAETSEDPINLAIYAAILEEIRRVTEIAKDKELDLRVGLCVDEMQYYVDNKDTVAFTQTKEAIYRWGRSNRLLRVWGTQRNEHLDTILQDDINKFSRTGTYQKVIKYFTIRDPGYCSYMDRQRENKWDLNLPYLVPYIKSPPPQFKIKE